MRLVAAVLALVLSSALPAHADPWNGVVPAPGDVVGVGDRTTDQLLDLLAQHYNGEVPPQADRLHSWDSVGTPLITVRSGRPPIVRPAECSHGLVLLSQTDSGVDFARCQRKIAETSDSPFVFRRFAKDTTVYVTATGSAVPTTLTTLQLARLYSATAGTPDCPYHAYLPALGSDTQALFLNSLGVSTPGTCARTTFAGVPVRTDDATPVLGDPLALVPHSAARSIGVPGLRANTIDDSARPAGVPANPVARISPGTGQLVPTGGVVGYDRELYHAFRKADWPGPRYQRIFGHGGWLCASTSANADLVATGFRRNYACGA